ncbi:MAG TPA: endonuclease/exonuclease/phosphatase family protein [Armatimonadota bacterium]|nr:endonuclease/exonuclease/phosphatase family protein [Armatimonadota bacterium]
MPTESDPKPRVPLRKRFARFVARLGVLAIAAIWVIQEAWGESTSWSVYITYAPPLAYLVIPAIVLAIAALSLDRIAIMWGIGCAALCLVTVAMPSLQLRSPQVSEARTIRVVTWNVHSAVDRIDEFRTVVAELDPDIICLQEAWSKRFRGIMPGADGFRSNSMLILTKGEIVDTEIIDPRLEDEPTRRDPPVATISLPQGEVSICCVHFYSYQLAGVVRDARKKSAWRQIGRTATRRAGQMAAVVEWLDRQTGPAIIAGDFNNPPRGRIYSELADRLTDSFARAGTGFGWSFPRARPVIRIDYVWTSEDLTPISCKALATGPSDHRPVVADIALPN